MCCCSQACQLALKDNCKEVSSISCHIIIFASKTDNSKTPDPSLPADRKLP